MKTLHLAVLILIALTTGGSAAFLVIRTGWTGPGFLLIYLGLLISLTCILRIIALLRWPRN
ncbi:MAG: hypothetical protein ABIV25_13155 [Paracoccaceae bacterium]